MYIVKLRINNPFLSVLENLAAELKQLLQAFWNRDVLEFGADNDSSRSVFDNN